ncbi:MAG TPA: AI-2E family transporter [Gammaproteobacteria bacterium]|nr:AI-2E family transporter [Gammaproteobacteria bacterium]
MNKFFVVFLGIIFFVLLYLLAPILTPFLIGMLLAYLVNPTVNLLMRLHLPRILAVIVVFSLLFIAITLLILLVIPLIQTQIEKLVTAFPDFLTWIQDTAVPSLKEYFNNQELLNTASIKSEITQNWLKAGGLAGWIVKTVLHSGFQLLHWMLDLILIFVVTFYLLYDWKKVVDGIHGLLPRKYEPTIMKLLNECDEVLGAFFRGQLMVMLILGTYYSIGLSLIGLQVGLVIGVMVGMLSIIPYLGIIMGVVSASIAAYIQFHSSVSVVQVLLLFIVGQTVEGMFITPKLVGDRIGLHPVAVIFAVLSGGVLFGFFGVLLALPVASVIMVLARFLHSRYRSSKLYR